MDTKKYIIEIPDNTAWLQWVKVSDKDGNVCFDFKYPEDLTPYIEPDLDAIRKEAYDKGFEDGKELCPVPEVCHENAYQRGLNDAWEAARKIAHLALWYDYRTETGKLNVCARDVLDYFSASEAIEKIRQYEREQEEIKVGNEVNGKGGRGTITKISDDGDHFNVMWENGSTGYYMIGDFKKTGRNFPEIIEVLRKMQEVRK